MDNVTHTLTGLVLARAGLERATPGATAALLVASNLPDADILAGLQGTAAYLQHHRDLSHSLLGLPFVALGLALAVRGLVRGSRLLALLLVSGIGVALHVFMDLWTSYGTRVLAPFDRTWFAWDLVFIVDPWILGLLAVGLLVGSRSRLEPRVASVALGLLFAYVGGRTVLHEQALEIARVSVPGAPQRLTVLPTPVDPWRYRVLADTGPAYLIGTLDLRQGRVLLERRDKRPEDAVVVRARESSAVAAIFLDFSSWPWLEVERAGDGTTVIWRDLRYERPGRESFVTRVELDREGRLLHEAFRF